jgi:hypothetical protein
VPALGIAGKELASRGLRLRAGGAQVISLLALLVQKVQMLTAARRRHHHAFGAPLSKVLHSIFLPFCCVEGRSAGAPA